MMDDFVGIQFWYLTIHTGLLSLAILLWLAAMSTGSGCGHGQLRKWLVVGNSWTAGIRDVSKRCWLLTKLAI